jgi:hypothetical protein
VDDLEALVRDYESLTDNCRRVFLRASWRVDHELDQHELDQSIVAALAVVGFVYRLSGPCEIPLPHLALCRITDRGRLALNYASAIAALKWEELLHAHRNR